MTGAVGTEGGFLSHGGISVHKFDQSNVFLKIRLSASPHHYRLILAAWWGERGGRGELPPHTQGKIKTPFSLSFFPPSPPHSRQNLSSIL